MDKLQKSVAGTRPSLPRLYDDNHGTITITQSGRTLRVWHYGNDNEHDLRIRMVCEFVAGWRYGYDSVSGRDPGSLKVW